MFVIDAAISGALAAGPFSCDRSAGLPKVGWQPLPDKSERNRSRNRPNQATRSRLCRMRRHGTTSMFFGFAHSGFQRPTRMDSSRCSWEIAVVSHAIATKSPQPQTGRTPFANWNARSGIPPGRVQTQLMRSGMLKTLAECAVPPAASGAAIGRRLATPPPRPFRRGPASPPARWRWRRAPWPR